uniref:Uncharacterized protein n=1 Tax=Rhizophora mucronata TaxID=61149 RepID=A0A2P2N5T2_RHIMU
MLNISKTSGLLSIYALLRIYSHFT